MCQRPYTSSEFHNLEVATYGATLMNAKGNVWPSLHCPVGNGCGELALICSINKKTVLYPRDFTVLARISLSISLYLSIHHQPINHVWLYIYVIYMTLHINLHLHESLTSPVPNLAFSPCPPGVDTQETACMPPKLSVPVTGEPSVQQVPS